MEIAHEALIVGWERLRDWIAEDRDFLVWRSKLGVAMAAWERSGMDDGALLRGGPLGEAQGWLIDRGDDLTLDEREYITRSRDTARRGRRRAIVLLTAGLAIFAVLALVASLYAWDRQNEANAAAAAAEASRVEATELQAQADAAEQAVADARSGLEKAEGEVQAAQEALDRVRALGGDAVAAAEEATKRAEEAERDLEQAEGDLATAQGNLATAYGELATAQQELAAADQELEDTQDLLAEVQGKLDGVGENLATAQETLGAVRKLIEEECVNLETLTEEQQAICNRFSLILRDLVFVEFDNSRVAVEG